MDVDTDDDTLRYELKLRLSYLRGLAFASLFCGAASWFVEPFAVRYEPALIAIASVGFAGRALPPVFRDRGLRSSTPTRGGVVVVVLAVLGVVLSIGCPVSRLPMFAR